MKDLEQALYSTFEDFRLSKNERCAFRALAADYRHDNEALSFARNKAFELAHEQMQRQTSFDRDAFKWLEHIVKTIDSVRPNPQQFDSHEAHFSPGNDCKKTIINLLNKARDNIDVCVFTISDDDISHALIEAHRRRVALRIITDDEKSHDMGSDIEELMAAGIAVRKDDSPSHMHHKFAVVDNSHLINGSFNWTRSASKYNDENITVLNSPALLGKFSHKFQSLWSSLHRR